VSILTGMSTSTAKELLGMSPTEYFSILFHARNFMPQNINTTTKTARRFKDKTN
jgi:hypothetical protein